MSQEGQILGETTASSSVAATSTLRAYLSYGSEIATIVMAFAAVLALRQLRLAKNAIQVAKTDISLRTKREAVLIAAQQCERFSTYLMKKSDALDALTNKGVPTDPWKLQNNDFDRTSIDDHAAMAKWLALEGKSGVDTMGFLNGLEAFAIYFAKGAADEQVAYSAVGPLFCDWVESLAPLIIDLRAGQHPSTTSGPFQNTVALYQTWAARAKKNALESSAAKLHAEAAAIRETRLRPIGPED